MERRNALWNCKNPHQGSDIKALCVCSAGLLRSPTIAKVMVERGYNARAVGIHDYALIQADEVLHQWAEVILFASQDVADVYETKFGLKGINYHVLDIPDIYEYNHPSLVKAIEEKLKDFDLV